MNENWTHIKTIADGDALEINGLNIWNFKWIDTRQSINIKDPNYGQDYVFGIYEITNDNKTIRFAAGEFSNCVWGIYINQ